MHYKNYKLLFYSIFQFSIMRKTQHTKHHDEEDSENEGQNNFLAIKELKDAENQACLLKNRIKVLQANDERNNRRLNNNKEKVEKLISIRESSKADIEKISQIKRQRQENTKTQKRKNKQLRKCTLESIRSQMEQIAIRRMQNHSKTIEEEEKNKAKIQRQKQRSQQQKNYRHNIAVEKEKNSKQNKLDYLQRKNMSIHETLVNEKQNYEKKKGKKLKQIQKLSKIQMELIKKQNQSRVAYKQTKNRLDSLLGKIRLENKQKKEALVPVTKQNSLTTSFYGL